MNLGCKCLIALALLFGTAMGFGAGGYILNQQYETIAQEDKILCGGK